MIAYLTNKEIRDLSNARKGLFGCNSANAKKYGCDYIGEAGGNTYVRVRYTL